MKAIYSARPLAKTPEPLAGMILSYPDSVDTRLLALLDNVAWAKRNCRHCDRPLWLVRVNGGYNVAYTSEGRNHLEDCPQYKQQSPGSQSMSCRDGPDGRVPPRA
jgi:hypothetical protein